MDFTIAWRNIWRNPRRTAVILIAVVIGIWSMVFIGAFMRGIEVGMIENGISTLTGDLKIFSRGYRSDPTVENSIENPRQLRRALAAVLPDGAHSAFRVRVNAVANNARHSAGVTLVGIDPSAEAKVSFIGDAVTRGEYLSPKNERGILMGKALLDTFETEPGHKLIIMAQDTTGEMTAEAFRISGVFRAEMQATEKKFVFVNRSAAQRMLKMDHHVSEVSVLLPDHKGGKALVETLRRHPDIGDHLNVHHWRDLLPVTSAYLEMSSGFIFIWYLVIFIAMGFGLTNTTLMAVFERMREFGCAIILGFGILGGNILGIASALVLKNTGIDLSGLAAGAEYAGISRVIFPELLPADILISNLVVFVLGALVSLYPASKAARFTPVQAMIHN